MHIVLVLFIEPAEVGLLLEVVTYTACLQDHLSLLHCHHLSVSVTRILFYSRNTHARARRGRGRGRERERGRERDADRDCSLTAHTHIRNTYVYNTCLFVCVGVYTIINMYFGMVALLLLYQLKA